MRTTRQVAQAFLKASLKANDELGIPTTEEEISYLTPLVAERDREVVTHALKSLDLAFSVESEMLTGQALYHYTRCRKLLGELLKHHQQRNDP